MKSPFKLSLISLAILAPAVSAEEIPLYHGDEIVVTATRTARTADETLASTTVITRRDIERSQAVSVQDLLQGLAGVSFANNGGAGKATSVFLRGTNSDHVVVLIDGIKVGSATTGTAAFQDFPVEQIERIELVRGPLSSLYGSEAIGGVIQIFTRKGGGALMPSASVMLGSYNTKQATANLSGGGENSWLNLGLSQLETDGFNATKGSTEPDKDGYRNTSLNLRAGYRFKPGSEVDFHLLRAQGRNDFDGSYQNQSESVQQAAGLSLKHQASELWSLKLAAGQSDDDSDNFLNGVFKSRFNTRRNTLSWQNDLALAPGHLFTLGLDRQEDVVSSTTAYAVTSRDTTGLFAQYQGRAGRQDFQFSLRRDDNSQFGAYTTGNAAWGRALADDLRVTLAYGTAFKAPTFNQLYWPGFGNPDLKPERSRSLEAGLGGKAGAGRWSLNAFETRVTDLIGFDGATNPVNASARIRGLEAFAALRLADWDTRLNLTLQDPENRSNTANYGKVLNRRAEQSLRLDLDRDLGAYRMGVTLRAEGRRYDNLANTTRLAGYGLVDLRAEYRMTRDLRLQARIENLFDKDYETVSLYNQPGRSLFVTLRYQPAK
ncbi:MAG: TonB-dependent vitamin B12 receptor [Sulfuricella sp.]|nr:TonB-dependent vitamin B12 receptor [Sulfuricella sp.]